MVNYKDPKRTEPLEDTLCDFDFTGGKISKKIKNQNYVMIIRTKLWTKIY